MALICSAVRAGRGPVSDAAPLPDAGARRGVPAGPVKPGEPAPVGGLQVLALAGAGLTGYRLRRSRRTAAGAAARLGGRADERPRARRDVKGRPAQRQLARRRGGRAAARTPRPPPLPSSDGVYVASSWPVG